jgi:hypothetical protein
VRHPGFVCDRPDPRDCPCCFQLQYVVCIPGCLSDANCESGQACTVTHHCVARACLGNGDCPQYFDCTSNAGTGAQLCARRLCSSDENCMGGFCVEGRCYDALGSCFSPIP